MKQEIHPEYVEATVHCSCGETFTTRATKPEIRIEICSKCHPFYSGKQKLVDTGGRVQRFQRKFGDYKAPEKTTKAAPREGEPAADPEEAAAQEPAPEEAADAEETLADEPAAEENPAPEEPPAEA